jgi:hypothetical protein
MFFVAAAVRQEHIEVCELVRGGQRLAALAHRDLSRLKAPAFCQKRHFHRAFDKKPWFSFSRLPGCGW